MPYLDYLRERVHAPVPERIALLTPPEEWMRFQIIDEIRNEWPGCSVTMMKAGEVSRVDMLIMPFEGKSPAHISIPHKEIKAEWIMLYGLVRRRIWILPRKEAVALVSQAKRLKTVRMLLANARIVRPVKWGIQLWKRFCRS